MLVPVVDRVGTPLQPTCSAKARRWLREGRCTKHFHRGTFYIRLKKTVLQPKTNIVLGIDPGFKRTAFTVTTHNRVVLNWLIDSENFVKSKVEKRKMYRQQRRSRKTPYRRCRFNRSHNKGSIPPSILSRWNRHLRLVTNLLKILPITDIVVEDIKAVTYNSKKKRLDDKHYASRGNVLFSPLQIGKNFFYISLGNMGINVYKKFGWQTCKHRKQNGYKKDSNKLSIKWEAHCVDSHSLCEMHYNKKIKLDKNMSFIKFLTFSRRELFRNHGKQRKRQGSTRTLGFNRGTLMYCSYVRRRYTEPIGLCYLAGHMKVNKADRVSLYNLQTNKEIGQSFKLTDCKMLTNLRYLCNNICNER